MKQEETARSWSRTHANGMIALMFEVGDQFSAGAAPANGTASIRYRIPGTLAVAQPYGDAQSGCLQPCTCQPWHDYPVAPIT